MTFWPPLRVQSIIPQNPIQTTKHATDASNAKG
jgi:hypothetical protein